MTVAPVGLLPLAPILQRLEDATRPVIHRFGTAADMAGATAANLVAGNAVVATVIVLGGSSRQIREGSGSFRQVVDVTFSVVVGIGLVGAAGAAGIARLEGPLNVARGALFGWMHPDAHAQDRCAHAGESLEDYDPKTGVLFYRLDFSTSVLLKEAP